MINFTKLKNFFVMISFTLFSLFLKFRFYLIVLKLFKLIYICISNLV